MKPQQRNFVVEYKSPRRQLKQQGSIWGNTNFKALAEAVEIDAPQLFETKAVSDGSERKLEVQSETAPVAPVIRAETAPTTSVIPDLADERVEQEGELEPISVKAVELAATFLKQPASKRAVRRQAKAPNLNRVGKNLPVAPAMPPASQEEVDDLVALDAENSRLKALLVNHLWEQNGWLRKMLVRFDIAGEV